MSLQFDTRWHYLPSDIVFKIITEFKPSTYWNRKFKKTMMELKNKLTRISFNCTLCHKNYKGNIYLNNEEYVGDNILYYYKDNNPKNNNIDHIDYYEKISSFFKVKNENWGTICSNCIPNWYGVEDPYFQEITWDNVNEINHILDHLQYYDGGIHTQMDLDEYNNEIESNNNFDENDDWFLDDFEEDYDL
jgi:hypothetical protein